MLNFKSLNLIQPILDALEKKGYDVATPIQEQAIPHILEKKDILGIAQTGTGKTAAFSLPIINHLALNRKPLKAKSMRVLILAPTRELATQIADSVNAYSGNIGLKQAVIFGGVSEVPQIAALKNGLDIVIATPGRLLDLTNQGLVKFDEVEILVLDEADRMLDMGFINDIKKIIRYLPKDRQTLFFSATMPREVNDLVASILKSPIKIEVTPESTTVEKISQKVHFVERGNKFGLLKHILKTNDVDSVLVFCKTKHGANKVVDYLQKENIDSSAIHSNKSQSARQKALQSFREGKIKVLIATDIAARGIDIPSVSHVINFDIPHEPQNYVHRIGRTARAGREGIAIAFCEPLERSLLKAVEKNMKKTIDVDNDHPFFGVAGQSLTRKISSSRSNVRPAKKAEENLSERPFRKYSKINFRKKEISDSVGDSRKDSRTNSGRTNSRNDSRDDDSRRSDSRTNSRSDSRFKPAKPRAKEGEERFENKKKYYPRAKSSKKTVKSKIKKFIKWIF